MLNPTPTILLHTSSYLYPMRIFLFLISLLFSTMVWCQSDMPLDMSKTLMEMQLEYLQPVEQSPKFIPAGKVKYFDYKFGLELDNGSTLVLVQSKKDDGNYIPHMMISALVATLATNNQDVKINMMSPADSYLKETNSDWAIEALFTPKDNIGEYGIAYLKSIFKEGVGVTNILYLAKTDVNIEPLLKYKN
ncbi:MAG: hypothetical protein ACI9P5_001775 [Saprospiraceae bacterium]|jgi:hypothetical protein